HVRTAAQRLTQRHQTQLHRKEILGQSLVEHASEFAPLQIPRLRELAGENAHLLGLAIVLLTRADGVRNINDRRKKPQAVRRLDRVDAELDWKLRAVLTNPEDIARRSEHSSARSPERFGRETTQERLDPMSQQLVARVTESAFGRGIHERHAPGL